MRITGRICAESDVRVIWGIGREKWNGAIRDEEGVKKTNRAVCQDFYKVHLSTEDVQENGGQA